MMGVYVITCWSPYSEIVYEYVDITDKDVCKIDKKDYQQQSIGLKLVNIVDFIMSEYY